MRTPLRAAVLAAAFTLPTAGCGVLGGEDAGNGGSTGEPAEAGAPVDTEETVVEAEYPIPGFAGGSADIEIHELRARERLAQLTFSITTNDPEGSWTLNWEPALDDIYDDGLPVFLIDLDNMQRHTVVADGNQQPLRTPADTELSLGRPITLTYTFAAPPEEVTNMDVHIGAFPPFTDVPVER